MQTFSEMGLSEPLLKAISELGFETPTDIQQEAIPQLLSSEQDLIALAQTGTGKTAAFGLPLLETIDSKSKTVQAVVLCPTRELCLQLSKDLQAYAKFDPAHIISVYGGTSIVNQIRELQRGVQIVVGTPGRTLDLIKRKKLDISNIKYMVFDEADEMLSMGFKDEMDAILKSTPDTKQTLLFSATMPPEIKKMASKYMNDPFRITIGHKNETSSNVEHIAYYTTGRNKYEALKRIVDSHPHIYGIVFCRTRAQTMEVAENLSRDKYNAEAIHGELSQAQRDGVMKKFRNKQVELLIATDVAARGLDVDSLTHVINYNLPDDLATYVHRSGRTGRAGNTGESLILVSGKDKSRMRQLEQKISKKIAKGDIPSGKEIVARQLDRHIEKIKQIEIYDKHISEYLPTIYANLEEMSKEELIQRIVSVEFNHIFTYYDKSGNLNDNSKGRDRDDDRGGRRRDRDRGRGRGERSERRSRRSDKSDREERRHRKGRGEKSESPKRERRKRQEQHDFTTYYINLGHKQKISPRTIFDLVNQYMPKKNVEIGNIEILKTHSFFQMDAKFDDVALKSFKRAKYKATKLFLEKSEGKSKK